MYINKYLKYKNKYLEYKNNIGGSNNAGRSILQAIQTPIQTQEEIQIDEKYKVYINSINNIDVLQDILNKNEIKKTNIESNYSNSRIDVNIYNKYISEIKKSNTVVLQRITQLRNQLRNQLIV